MERSYAEKNFLVNDEVDFIVTLISQGQLEHASLQMPAATTMARKDMDKNSKELAATAAAAHQSLRGRESRQSDANYDLFAAIVGDGTNNNAATHVSRKDDDGDFATYDFGTVDLHSEERQLCCIVTGQATDGDVLGRRGQQSVGKNIDSGVPLPSSKKRALCASAAPRQGFKNAKLYREDSQTMDGIARCRRECEALVGFTVAFRGPNHGNGIALDGPSHGDDDDAPTAASMVSPTDQFLQLLSTLCGARGSADFIASMDAYVSRLGMLARLAATLPSTAWKR